MRTLRATAAGAALALALVGCSGEPVDDPTVQRPPGAATSAPPAAGAPAVTLTGNGIDTEDALLEFGSASVDDVRAALRDALGEPTLAPEAAGADVPCLGDPAVVLEYSGGALQVLFDEAEGEQAMSAWALLDAGEPEAAPPASALVGDVTTYDFGIGVGVAELRAGAQGAELELTPPASGEAEPTFRLIDQSSGFVGTLSGESDSDTVTSVVAGQGCGGL